MRPEDPQKPEQLGLPLPMRELLWGLDAATRKELLEVIGEMLLQAEKTSRGGANDCSHSDD